MKLWKEGRQKSGYKTLTLFNISSRFLKSDSHIIQYPEGAFIPEHTDPVDDFSHYRLNFIIKKPIQGGVFYSEKTVFSFLNRLFIFRPDQCKHSVSKVIKGKRIVYSFGIAFKKT